MPCSDDISIINRPFHAEISNPYTHSARLCGCVEGVWEAAHVVLDWALVAEELDVSTIDANGTSLALLDVVGTIERSESPLLGDNDLLATRELVLRPTESLDGGSAVYSACQW